MGPVSRVDAPAIVGDADGDAAGGGCRLQLDAPAARGYRLQSVEQHVQQNLPQVAGVGPHLQIGGHGHRQLHALLLQACLHHAEHRLHRLRQGADCGGGRPWAGVVDQLGDQEVHPLNLLRHHAGGLAA